MLGANLSNKVILRTSNHGTESGVIVGDTTFPVSSASTYQKSSSPKIALWIWGQDMLGFVLTSLKVHKHILLLLLFFLFVLFCVPLNLQGDYAHPAVPSGKQHSSVLPPSCSGICTVNPPTYRESRTCTRTLQRCSPLFSRCFCKFTRIHVNIII